MFSSHHDVAVHPSCLITLLPRSYARSADGLKELIQLIPNFQKKIDEPRARPSQMMPKSFIAQYVCNVTQDDIQVYKQQSR